MHRELDVRTAVLRTESDGSVVMIPEEQMFIYLKVGDEYYPSFAVTDSDEGVVMPYVPEWERPHNVDKPYLRTGTELT